MVQRCLTYFTFCASAVSRCGNSRQPRQQLSRKRKSERVSQSLLHPPLLSLSPLSVFPLRFSLSLSLSLPRGSRCRMYRWMELKAQHQEADAFGASPASAGHLLSLAVGIEGCAVLASFPHPFSPLPFYLHFQALPLQAGLSDTVAGPFLAASPPLSVWSPSKGPR